MAFNTRRQALVITDLGSSYELDESIPRRNAEGWDDWMGVFYRRGAVSAAGLAGDWPIGSKLSSAAIDGADLWVQGVTERPVGCGIYRVEVSAKGLLYQRGTVVCYGAAAQLQSAENVTIDGTTYARAEVCESDVTAQVRYISDDPPTENVGQSRTPARAPQVRSSGWNSIENPLYQYPNGWVLMSTSAEPLPGVSPAIYLISDDYQYRYPFVP